MTPAGEPRMSGRAFRLPERPEEAKSSTGSTSVISGGLEGGAEEQRSATQTQGACFTVGRLGKGKRRGGAEERRSGGVEEQRREGVKMERRGAEE